MRLFEEAYQQLNTAQKQAVDTIDGPVIVVAGPGTGKTQLLSMRVANILRVTDSLPSNILCLTFTESAAMAMRQRLVSLMGAEAYKVAIHTFHSFGTEIINHNPEFFYEGARFQAANELSSYEVLEPIFANLPHHNPLASTINGEFTALRDTQAAIGHLKKAGLSPDELRQILDHNQAFLNFAEPLCAALLASGRLSLKKLPSYNQLYQQLQAYTPPTSDFKLFTPLHEVFCHQLQAALEHSQNTTSTKPVTAWHNQWFEKDHEGNFIFKDRNRYKKLQAVADVYHKYRKAMDEHELFDFDDMIVRVVHALETKPSLRFNLQEQYLYILVDEFQDTNGAQLRLLQNLTNNQVSEGRPNIMVVGDDDQAIYAFQGAELSNILQFTAAYRDPAVITLTENYRSTATVLQSARQVITQGGQRLETTLVGLNKDLTPHNDHEQTTSELHSFTTINHQQQWVVEQIKQQLANGMPPSQIAILGRHHKQLLEILPFLHEANIPVQYERRNNVLEAEHVTALVTLTRTVVALAQQQFDVVEALLPQLLSYEFWGLSTEDIWQLSLQAYRQKRFWLEIMLEQDETSKAKAPLNHRLREIAEFLIVASHRCLHEPLEVMLDILIGSNESQVTDSDEAEPTTPQLSLLENTQPSFDEGFISPFRAYYFNAEHLAQDPADYLRMLSNLAVIRQQLRNYRPDQPLLLTDFVNFVDLHQKTNIPIVDVAEHRDETAAIHVMTAHKAKGLEFDSVFVLSCQESIWGTSARSHNSSIRFPHNVPIAPAGDNADDVLRLFFVAMTRARHNLYLCTYQFDEKGKESLPAAFLQRPEFTPITHDSSQAQHLAAKTLEPSWHIRHLRTPKAQQETLLAPRLETYQLSSTHVNNFVDVTTGGPQAFLLQNLLRFPQATTTNAIFGSAIHAVLQRAHMHLSASGQRRPVEDILQDFEIHLQNARLSERDFNYLLEKGSDILTHYLKERYDSFNPEQKAEYSFANQSVCLGDARLTGAIDLLEINQTNKTVTVTDYKTSKPAIDWRGRTDFEKIKLHKYRQQLMMYKLLVEQSRDFGGQYTVDKGVLEFVEAGSNGKIHCLELAFNEDELATFKQLISVIWRHIMELNIPDTSNYEPSYKGILQFEHDLLE